MTNNDVIVKKVINIDQNSVSRSQTAMAFQQSVSILSTESVGSRRELVANSFHVHNADADATQLDSWGSTMTATNHDDQLVEIYPTMLNELKYMFGVSFSRLHCSGRHGIGPTVASRRRRRYVSQLCGRLNIMQSVRSANYIVREEGRQGYDYVGGVA